MRDRRHVRAHRPRRPASRFSESNAEVYGRASSCELQRAQCRHSARYVENLVHAGPLQQARGEARAETAFADGRDRRVAWACRPRAATISPTGMLRAPSMCPACHSRFVRTSTTCGPLAGDPAARSARQPSSAVMLRDRKAERMPGVEPAVDDASDRVETDAEQLAPTRPSAAGDATGPPSVGQAARSARQAAAPIRPSSRLWIRRRCSGRRSDGPCRNARRAA